MSATAEAVQRGEVPAGMPEGRELGRIRNLNEAFDRFPAELVEDMMSQCLKKDELGYRAYLEFADPDANSSWRQFEQALEQGIDAIDKPAPGLKAFFDSLDNPPAWVDHAQLERGAVAIWRTGPLVPIVFAYSTVAAGFVEPSGSRPVLFSGRLMSRERIGQRLLESFRFIANAYRPGGMGRFEEGFKLTVRVRMMHAAVSAAVGKTQEWRWHEWGWPINNFDTMNTQAGQFGVQVVDSLAKAGIRLSEQEREDYFALSRYVGYIIGVPEEILHTDEQDARLKNNLHSLVESPTDDGCRTIVNGIVDYSCEESFGGYDVLPGWLSSLMTVERRKKLARGLICAWQPQFVEPLKYKPDAWRHALSVARPFLRMGNVLSRMTPEKDGERAEKVLKEFSVAIASAKGERQLADPEELQSDIHKHSHEVGHHTVTS